MIVVGLKIRPLYGVLPVQSSYCIVLILWNYMLLMKWMLIKYSIINQSSSSPNIWILLYHLVGQSLTWPNNKHVEDRYGVVHQDIYQYPTFLKPFPIYNTLVDADWLFDSVNDIQRNRMVIKFIHMITSGPLHVVY